jgi:hypothetical protein
MQVLQNQEVRLGLARDGFARKGSGHAFTGQYTRKEEHVEYVKAQAIYHITV